MHLYESSSAAPKITVFGVGGVGGTLSAMLLKKYGGNVTLIARGARKEHLLQNGLTMHGDVFGDFTVPAENVTDDPSTLPPQDIVIICVKNDALEKAADALRPVIHKDTVVVPVMNGVTAYQTLLDRLSCGRVLPSVIYTVSISLPDYTVVQKGGYTTVFAGPLKVSPEYPQGSNADANMTADEEEVVLQNKAAEFFVNTLAAADIDCRLSDHILVNVWSKYILNCAYNVSTARWDCTIGDVKSDPQRYSDYRRLMQEAYSVGCALGIPLPSDLLEKHMKRLDNTTDDSTSSLSRDFAEGREGEMEIFCGDVVRMAENLEIDVPITKEYYKALRDIAATFH